MFSDIPLWVQDFFGGGEEPPKYGWQALYYNQCTLGPSWYPIWQRE